MLNKQQIVQNKKLLIIALLIIISITIPLISFAIIYSQGNRIVSIVDEHLDEIIRSSVGKPEGDLTVRDLFSIRELDASEAEINSLDGIENVKNLKILKLRGNNLIDIAPLSQLKKLTELDLEDNNIKDIGALARLIRLEKLNLKDNMIEDIEALGSIESLKKLNMQGNRITSINALTALKQLNNLDLQNNRIKDFSPLINIKGIKEKLNISGNYTNDYTVLKPIYHQITDKDFYTEKFTGVPQIYIDTGGKQVVSLNDRIEATMKIMNGEGSNYPEDGLYNGRIGIRGRGNTSWAVDKKPYNIELWDNEGRAVDAGILDMPEESDWLLIPNYYDKSLMRNFLALDTAAKIGMPYVPKARYAELYFNGSYEGNYLIVERIKRDKNRVGIKKLSSNKRDCTQPRITGGYILQIDWVKDSEYFRSDITNQDIIMTYPKPEDMTIEQEIYIMKYIKDTETVLYDDDFKEPENGYRKYIDVDSFIDYFLINELAKNVDAWRLSTYFYKDRDEKLAIGPVWDYDIAFGNVNYMDGWKAVGANSNFTEHRSWYSRLLQDEYFVDKLHKRWAEIKPIIDAIPYRIDETANMIGESSERNFDRWKILGIYVWPNVAPYPETYQGEVENLKKWVTARIAWMDLQYGRYLKDN